MSAIASPPSLANVLIVEDKPMYHGMYRLEFCDKYRVTIVADAAQAIKTLASQDADSVDVYVIDLKIPQRLGTEDKVEIGLDLIKEVRKRWPQKPLFVTSSVVIDETLSGKLAAIDVEKSAIFEKPFLLKDLHAAVDAALKQPKPR